LNIEKSINIEIFIISMIADYLSLLTAWLDKNLGSFIISAIALIIVFLVYNFLSSQIQKLKRSEHFDENSAFLVNRLLTWVFYIIEGAIIFNFLGVQVDFLVGLWVLAGGTIIGFASINTIGNAISGLILMGSRPFKIGDRLFFQEQYVDVEDIDLIYTRMRTIDNILISVPNQTLIESVINNYGISRIVRRRIPVTVGYDTEPVSIKKALLKALSCIENVVEEPSPFVWITDFQNFAIEYTLFYYLADSKNIMETDSLVRENIYTEFTKIGIDLTTPNIIQSARRTSQ
jgi:small-conductance mechanosensitive channel